MAKADAQTEKMPSHWGPDWQWFALRVAPGRELAVEADLREADHFTFLPVRHVVGKTRRRAGKRKVVAARAQYPGYVFIGFPPDFAAPWVTILDIDGVNGVVGRQGEPMPLHEPTMTAMISRALLVSARIGAIDGVVHRSAPRRRRKTKHQTNAEIISGPYQGRVVRVVEITGDDPELYELLKVAA